MATGVWFFGTDSSISRKNAAKNLPLEEKPLQSWTCSYPHGETNADAFRLPAPRTLLERLVRRVNSLLLD
jgi:hypothetical protein